MVSLVYFQRRHISFGSNNQIVSGVFKVFLDFGIVQFVDRGSIVFFFIIDDNIFGAVADLFSGILFVRNKPGGLFGHSSYFGTLFVCQAWVKRHNAFFFNMEGDGFLFPGFGIDLVESITECINTFFYTEQQRIVAVAVVGKNILLIFKKQPFFQTGVTFSYLVPNFHDCENNDNK